MKVLVTNYTFNASAKTVTFNSYANVDQNRILLITNATKNTIIYNFASPALGGAVAGNVLTLNTNTAGMTNSDTLQIFYENEDTPATDQMITLLNRVVASLRGAQNVDNNDRIRVALDGSNTTVTAAASLNNITNSSFDFRDFLYAMDRTNYGASIRPLITQT